MTSPVASPWRDPAPVSPAPVRRGGASLLISIGLGLLTCLSTLIVGAGFSASAGPALERMASGDPLRAVEGLVEFVLAGLPYCVALMVFFLAHEMGHFLACRWYGVDATPPFFIPAPTLFGTFGAVIRIRGQIPHRRALFDIGVAGPLAGFVVAVPAVVIGVLTAKAVPAGPPPPGSLVFGDSLLTHWLVAWLRPAAADAELMVGPLYVAGWLGLLATAMNLIPAGQFDGGHIVYAVAPRWHRLIGSCSAAFLAALVIARYAIYREWSAWALWAVILLWLGRRHPPVPDDGTSLGAGRVALALAALVVLALAFMPHPINVS